MVIQMQIGRVAHMIGDRLVAMLFHLVVLWLVGLARSNP